MIKKHIQNVDAYTIEQVADEIKLSTRGSGRNNAIILEKKDFGDWKGATQLFFKKLPGITNFGVGHRFVNNH